MALFATMSYDDEDPDLHVHLTARARDLDQHNPRELARVLHTMEDALTDYAARVGRVRATIERRLEDEADERRARA